MFVVFRQHSCISGPELNKNKTKQKTTVFSSKKCIVLELLGSLSPPEALKNFWSQLTAK